MALAVLGANAKKGTGSLWTEALAIVVAGLLGGLATGALIAAQHTVASARWAGKVDASRLRDL